MFDKRVLVEGRADGGWRMDGWARNRGKGKGRTSLRTSTLLERGLFRVENTHKPERRKEGKLIKKTQPTPPFPSDGDSRHHTGDAMEPRRRAASQPGSS